MDDPRLLPGVSPLEAEPKVVFQSGKLIRRARLRASIRDAADLFLLLLIDALFIGWPHAHVPLLGRSDSVIVLLVANAVIIAAVWLMRRVPQWRARRLASTWSASERQRLRF